MKKLITKTLLIAIAGVGVSTLSTISSAQAYNVQTHNVTDWVGHTLDDYTDTVKLLKDDRFIKPVQTFNITADIFARVYNIKYTEKKTTDLPYKINYTFNHECNIKFLLDKDNNITKGELSGSDLACEQVSQRLGLTPPHKKTSADVPSSDKTSSDKTSADVPSSDKTSSDVSTTPATSK